MSEQTTLPAVAAHGADRLPSVHVDSYNLEIKDNQGFIGDRASKGAFRKVIDDIRKSVRKTSDDPLGDDESDELTKVELDNLLTRGRPGSGRHRAECNRGLLTGICPRHSPLHETERMEGHGSGSRSAGAFAAAAWASS